MASALDQIRALQTAAARLSSRKQLVDAGRRLCKLYAFEDALACFRRAVGSGGSELTANEWLAVARLWFRHGRFEIALEFVDHALRNDAGSEHAMIIRAELLERLGRGGEAGEQLRQIGRDSVWRPRACRLSGRMLRQEAALDDAEQTLLDCLREREWPDSWRLLHELARVLDAQNRYDEAMRRLAQAKALIKAAVQKHNYPLQLERVARRQTEATALLTNERLTAWRGRAESCQPLPEIGILTGFPRSGTTLVERALECQLGCHATDESGVLLNEFRDPLLFEADSGADYIAELDGYRSEELDAGRAEYLRCTEACLGGFRGGRTLIEKEPMLTADLAIPLFLLPEAKLLIMLRDPRDVIVSYFFAIAPLAWHSSPAANLAYTFAHYARTMAHWLHLREALSGQAREIRYEDFVHQPEGTLGKLRSFLRLAVDDNRTAISQRVSRTPNYSELRRPVSTSSVGRWRNYARWIEPHAYFLQPFLDAFGYD